MGLYPLVRNVALVADQDALDALRCKLLDIPDPIAHIIEAPLVGHVVDNQDAHGTAIVGCRDGAKALLPSRVPYLKTTAGRVGWRKLEGTDFEVDADGGDEGGRKGVVTEAKQQTTLPNT